MAVYAIPEGSIVFPKVPLMRIEGPVAVSPLASNYLYKFTCLCAHFLFLAVSAYSLIY